MSKTLANLRTGLSYWLDEAGAVGGLAGGAASTESRQWINWGYADCLRIFPKATRDIRLKTGPISTVSGIELYPLPLDFQWLKYVEAGWHAGSVASDRYQVLPIAYDERNMYYDNPISGTNAQRALFYYMQESEEKTTPTRQIGFVPIPGESKTAYIKLWYWPVGTELSLEADAILPFLEDYWELICIKAAIKILTKASMDPIRLIPHHDLLMKDLKQNLAAIQQQAPEQTRFYDDEYANF